MTSRATRGPRRARPRAASRGAGLWLTVCLSVAVFVACAVASASTRAPTGSVEPGSRSRLALYALPAKHRFVNNIDDLSRGEGNNPFGNYSGSTARLPPNETIFGPFPGDEGIYGFSLTAGADHKAGAGSAIFLCWYDFDKNALCDAAFRLDGGDLICKGAANFTDTTFTLAVVGGTEAYRRVKGHVVVTAAGRATQRQPVVRAVPLLQAQRLDFVLVSA